jgi:DNA-binding NtrC family response regulator
MAGTQTERLDEPELDPRRARPLRTWLVQIGCASAPLRAPWLAVLDGQPRWILGRAGAVDGPGRLESTDRWMSGEHAALEREADGWRVRDLGSSNGTLVRGERCSTAALSDGDVVETGGTFWLFRAQRLAAPPAAHPGEGPLASLHPPTVATAERLARVARTRVPVLLRGATGTGKEVLARELHARSGRAGPFLAINTAAVQPSLVASELFGVERGAHSMADRPRPGQIRAAQGGTLLLDELGDMPLEVQVSLLRVLQESELVPVGGDAPVPIDVRFVSATHQDLERRVEDGRFREDLLSRLRGVTLDIAALAERPEDLGLLAGRLLLRLGAERLAFAPAAYRALLHHDWPMNVRELERALETAAALAEGGRVEVEHLPETLRGLPRTARAASEGDERRRELVRLLGAHRGNVTAVARTMGYSRMQVHRWLKQLELDPDAFRGG